jgi:hypothetical protein
MTPQEQELIKGLFDRLSQNCSPFPFGWSGEYLSGSGGRRSPM